MMSADTGTGLVGLDNDVCLKPLSNPTKPVVPVSNRHHYLIQLSLLFQLA
jgi:hypothetical protein